MGLLLLKFVIMASIFGGLIKIYLGDIPFIHDYPKTSGGILILTFLFLIWIIPRSLGFIFKMLIILAIIGLVAFGAMKVFNWGGDWISGLSFSSPSKPVTEVIEEAIEEHKTSIQSFEGDDKKVTGLVTEVRSGYFFQIGSSFIKLYAIDAPDPVQECRDKRGDKYPCGDMAKEALESLILKKVVTCTPVGGDGIGNYIATCSIEGVDVGSAMVTSGWALADRTQSKVYIPYEKEANQNKAGLWEGKFTAPWTYRAKKQSTQQTSSKGGFLGLF